MKTKDSIILGLCLVVAALIFGILFYNSRAERDTIHVIGSSTKRYKADIVKWRVTVSRTAPTNDMKGGYSLLHSDISTIRKYLITNGIDEKDITVEPIESNPKFDRNSQQIGYDLRQIFFVLSKDIPKLEKLALNPSFIVERGIVLENARLEYYFSALPDIKKELLAEATKDAKARAEVIAKTSGVQLDRMIYCHTGSFQINEPYSNEVQYGGVYNTSTQDKDVNITLDATFTLK